MKKENNFLNLIKRFLLVIKGLRWIDIFGMSIFLFILGIAFFFFLRKGQYVNILLRVSESQALSLWGGKTPTWYLENLKPGLEQKDLLGKSIISVVDSKSFRTSEQNKIFFITLRLKAVYTPRTKEYVFNGVPILIGSFQTFNLNGIKVMGVVQKVNGMMNNYEKKKLILKGVLDPVYNGDPRALAGNMVSDGIEKYLSSSFKEGMTMKDSQDNIILKIKRIQRLPATKQFIYKNNLIKVRDYEKDKVKMELEVSVDKINESYIFMDENTIKINSTLYLDFMQFGSSFIVTSIQEL